MSGIAPPVLPSKEECIDMINNFAELTNTNEVVAQFYLQNSWNISTAIDLYFEIQAANAAPQPQMDEGSSEDEIIEVQQVQEESASASFVQDGTIASATTEPRRLFRFLSWNIDGIDDKNLMLRMKAVVEIISQCNYDIVHLQEVTPKLQKYFEEELPQYKLIAGGDKEYYVVTLLKLTTVYFDSKMIHNFPNSVMGRHLLEVQAHIGKMNLRLLNTHLESTAAFSSQRKVQLQNVFAQLVRGQKNNVSILAGDLNARDKEVDQVGIPYGSIDLWVEGGMRKECQYTWDLNRNTNKTMPGNRQPKCRFDRAFLYQTDYELHPLFFGLEGFTKVEGTQSFPSDHWGIQAHFKIADNSTRLQREINIHRQKSRSLKTMECSSLYEDDDLVVLD